MFLNSISLGSTELMFRKAEKCGRVQTNIYTLSRLHYFENAANIFKHPVDVSMKMRLINQKCVFTP